MKTYAKLLPLVKNPETVKGPKDIKVDETVRALARRFEKTRDQGSFEVQVSDGKIPPIRLELNGGKPSIGGESTERADFTIKASSATLAAMAKGDLSPVTAYLAGQMEVHGDLDFGKRLFARLATKSGDKEL